MEYNGVKVIRDIWLTNPYVDDWCWNRDVIVGILKTKDLVSNNIHYYVGQCSGKDIKEDMKAILSFGTKYTEEYFKSFFNNFLK